MVEPGGAAADPATHQALEQQLAAALQALSVRNDDVVRSCNSAFDEGAWIAATQLKAKESTAQELGQAFNPQVLAVLKRNADQLQELKQQHIAQKQMTRDTTKKLMWWASGQQHTNTAAAADDLQADAVKHGRFKFFQLPGSSISSGANTASSGSSNQTAAALKFWQTGLPAGAAPRTFSDTHCGADQLQPQKSFTNLLFGKARRSSSGGGAPPAAAAPGSRRPSDAATNSWRSSNDGGSRRTSGRSSDSGTLRASASFGTQMMMPQQQPAAAQDQQQQQQGGGVWASLAAGEGPLSKSHSLLARTSLPQEHAVGKELECVAEDDREGRDSPQPAAGCILEPALMATFNPAQHSLQLSSLRAQLAGQGQSTSPVESFSFGNKQEDEQPHSPSFGLRASVSSRLRERGQSGDTAPGPLMRSSVALACSRMDPFDAPEPQPQPFVEKMRAEDQAMKAAGSAAREAGAAASNGLMGALRRSMGGALRTGAMAAAAPAALAAAAARPAGLLVRRQVQQPRPLLLDGSSPGPLTGGGGHMLGQQQAQQASPNPTAGQMPEFLDLDAAAKYAKGVHETSIDILGRPSVGHSKQLVNSSVAAVRLTDVYSATSGNLTPLSAGLTSIRRQSSSSQSSRTTLPPRARTSPRALVSEASMQAATMPAAGMGPLAAQHSSTMLHAKKQAGAAAAGHQEGSGPGRKSPWGWQSLGLPTGPGAPLADATIDPLTYPKGNKYAASWGLIDAAATAAASPGGGLSRQASAIAGGLSRQQSQAALQGQLSRQSSMTSQRQSPRYPEQQGMAGTPGRQYSAGAAGRYAQQAASVTPVESPRSAGGTPRRGSDSGRQGQGGGNAGKTLQSRRISDVGSAASDDSGAYASADEHSRASSFSGYTSAGSAGPDRSPGVARGAWQRGNSATQQGSGSRKMLSPIPVPPAFLQSTQPTSAQAAVAAAWSPNKHASAMVQAPAYMRSAYVSPEASAVQYGELPRGLAGAAAYSNQQQQPVMTAVDLARRNMRRTSSSGGATHGGVYGSRQPETPGYLGAARDNAAGVRGVGGAAGKAVYGPRQLQGRNGGRGLVAGGFEEY
ncbi:hypothetical protein OEZ86_000186 [Tetradesmus obliquus]|nr:hypothetical protein OEZ86_000186 [Tetradesmus obliquus]